jgi:hypothetical protein
MWKTDRSVNHESSNHRSRFSTSTVGDNEEDVVQRVEGDANVPTGAPEVTEVTHTEPENAANNNTTERTDTTAVHKDEVNTEVTPKVIITGVINDKKRTIDMTVDDSTENSDFENKNTNDDNDTISSTCNVDNSDVYLGPGGGSRRRRRLEVKPNVDCARVRVSRSLSK